MNILGHPPTLHCSKGAMRDQETSRDVRAAPPPASPATTKILLRDYAKAVLGCIGAVVVGVIFGVGPFFLMMFVFAHSMYVFMFMSLAAMAGLPGAIAGGIVWAKRTPATVARWRRWAIASVVVVVIVVLFYLGLFEVFRPHPGERGLYHDL
jgi:hypothetical protein